MRKTIEIEQCDLCKKETETFRIAVPTYRTFDAEEGKIHYDKKKYYSEELDLCEECLKKVTVVHSIGVMCEEYVLEKV